MAMERAVITSRWNTSGSKSLLSVLELFKHCTALLSRAWSCKQEIPKLHSHLYFVSNTETTKRCLDYPDVGISGQYLVVMVGCAASVQTGQKAFGLLLDSSRSRHGQQQSGQLQSRGFVFLLKKCTVIHKTMQTQILKMSYSQNNLNNHFLQTFFWNHWFLLVHSGRPSFTHPLTGWTNCIAAL